MDDNYCKRVFLNKPSSPSTGSIVVFDGVANWETGNGEPEKTMFIEVADCHSKARLHQSRRETRQEFIDKARLMRDTLTDFIDNVSV